MITKESLAIRASKMLVGKHMAEHSEYEYAIYDEKWNEYSLPWTEIYETLTKMVKEKENEEENKREANDGIGE